MNKIKKRTFLGCIVDLPTDNQVFAAAIFSFVVKSICTKCCPKGLVFLACTQCSRSILKRNQTACL